MGTHPYPPDPEGNVLAAHREDWPVPKQIAGVTLPDSALAREAMEFVRTESAPIVFNHAVRVYVLGELIGRARGMEIDSELFFLGAICHDLGQTERFIGNERFEVEGADAAAQWLRARGVEDHRAEIVWEAIALHGTGIIAERKRPEIALVALGATADLIGASPTDVPPETVQTVMRTIPRLRMKHDYVRVLVEMARRRPIETTIGTPLADFGHAHIPGFEPVVFERLMRAAPYDE